MSTDSLWDDLHTHLEARTLESSARIATYRDELAGDCAKCGEPLASTLQWRPDDAGTVMSFCQSCADLDPPRVGSI
jgi:hypothetical protein